MKHLLRIAGLMAGATAGVTAVVTLSMPSQSCAQHASQGAVQAVYATKAEAEKAAARFNCKGAHQMGDKWMPCAAHGDAKTNAH